LELRRSIGIPNTLADIGVPDNAPEKLAQQAFDDPSTGGNPLPMQPEHFVKLYHNCIHGVLAS
jgi:alcohol dehydrogenase class IV